jgi:DNA-binding transcriptional MerR regulator
MGLRCLVGLHMNEDRSYTLTASGAGKLLNVTGSAIVALANRGQIACVRDSSNRRLFSRGDIEALRKQRESRQRAA